MYTRWNDTNKWFEKDTSADQDGSGPLVELPVDGSQIGQGTITDNRLSSNVPLINGNNNFTNINTFSGQPVAICNNNGTYFSIPNATDTVLTFNQNLVNIGNVHSNLSITSRFTVQTNSAGIWLLIGSVLFVTNTTAYFRTRTVKNGTTELNRTELVSYTGGNESALNISILDNGSVNDYYEFYVYQATGSTINIYNPSTSGCAIKLV